MVCAVVVTSAASGVVVVFGGGMVAKPASLVWVVAVAVAVAVVAAQRCRQPEQAPNHAKTGHFAQPERTLAGRRRSRGVLAGPGAV